MSTTTQNRDRSAANNLNHSLSEVRRRLYSIGLLAAFGWVLLTIVAVLFIAVWFDLLWELPAGARIGAFFTAGGFGLIVFTLFVISLWRKSRGRWLAARLDQVGETGGEITSGLDLAIRSEASRIVPNPSADEIERGLAALAVDKAATKAAQIDRSIVVSASPVKMVSIAIVGVALVIAAIEFTMPKLVKTQWARFANPTNDVPPFTMMEFAVTPGNVAIKYGSPLEIVVETNLSPVDDLQLWIKGTSEEFVPMFAEGNNQWRTTLFRVTEPIEYQVQSGRSKSSKFKVNLILVPEIREVKFRLTPPEYTRLGSTIVSASEAIAGLKGTIVEVTASSNVPLKKGNLVLTSNHATTTIELKPNGSIDNEVVGQFPIEAAGKFELKLVNFEGVESNQSIAGSIVLLTDDRPFVRLLSPKQNSWATATVNLPVVIEGEDDFGIANLSLYRSLNDSRPRPLKIKLSKTTSRINERFYLPLADYDLRPGDTLELFARVEDNDPESTKGSESPIHSVQIISQEQYEELQREQMGIEAVLAKYRQIQRRLEALEAMQREIDEMDAANPDGKPNEEKKQRMIATAQGFKDSAKEMQKLLERRVPIDFDTDLEKRIDEMSEKMIEISREINQLIREIEQDKLNNRQLRERLKELREKLENIRNEFNDQVMDPLGKLAKAFELMRLQQEFVQIVLRQRNLADRLQSLDGTEDPDQPDVKRRMREMSDEQTMLEDALDNTLFEIENKAFQLPADPEFNELRDSAVQFVADVEQSGALEEQTLAATGLAEFSGTRGFQHATKAAELLEQFIQQAEEMSDQADQALNQIFDPKMGRPRLGNSLKQLMDMFGPKNGMRQQGAGNRGLYGDQPQSQAEQRSGSGEDQRSGSGTFSGSPTGDSGLGSEISRQGGNTGNSQIAIPLQYEKKVGEYYRRIVEELGDDR